MILNKSPQQVVSPASTVTYRATESQVWMHEKNEKFDGTSRLVICNHGHGANSTQFEYNVGPAMGAVALARTGRYICMSIDTGGPTEWGNSNSQQAILDAVAWARAHGARAGKYGLVGWSMGGFNSLVHIGQNPAAVAGAWLWVPGCDGRYFANTYANPYGAARNTNYASEFTPAYAAGNTLAQQDPMQNIAKYQGIEVPTYFALASDDTVIPPAQADYFLAQVANPSFFQSPKGKVLGGHTDLFSNFSDDEFVAHFDSLVW